MKKFAVLLSVLLMLPMLPMLLIPVQSSADSDYSLTVRYESEGNRISNAIFRIYLAMDFNGKLIGDFKDYDILVGDFDDSEAMSDLSDTLSAYAALDQIVPARVGITNERGEVTFDNLEPGVYLVEGLPTMIGDTIYTCKPCVISVPYMLEDKTELADVVIQAKFAVRSASSGALDYTVRKVWDNPVGLPAPESVTVQLLENGKPYGGTITLNEQNGWEYTWKNLSPTSLWQVVEIDIPENYQVLIRLDETIFIIKNTWTGDDSSFTDVPETTTTTSTTATETSTTSVPAGTTPHTEVSSVPPASSETTITTTATASSGSSPAATTIPPTKTTTAPPPGKTEEPKLPQTGQLWWPVPVLLIGGALLFLAGVLGSDLDEDEKT